MQHAIGLDLTPYHHGLFSSRRDEVYPALTTMLLYRSTHSFTPRHAINGGLNESNPPLILLHCRPFYVICSREAGSPNGSELLLAV